MDHSHSHSENSPYGVNIIHNADFNQGLAEWVPFGCCTLSISNKSTTIHENSFDSDLTKNINGHYILASERADIYAGPAQFVTGRVERNLTYQVSVWVRVESGTVLGPQQVNVRLCLDDEWIGAGQMHAHLDKWYEVKGSFRLDKAASKIMMCISGPRPGVDLSVNTPKICGVNRKARFEYLKQKTDKVRKREVVLQFQGLNDIDLTNASVKITQVYNSFPFGSCISRAGINNKGLADFFIKNFTWAVFENELKWYWTEAERNKINYNDSDFLLDFCRQHNKIVRGHCIFWEKEDMVQPWIKSLDRNELMWSVQNRLTSLLTRYKGKFVHHDVNNEMLHGSFYKDQLGQDISAYMFHEAHRLDAFATLFVNDYNVEDECDPDSTPEKYIQQILDLQERGAKVGGIGVQGHLMNPIGEILCNSLDKLSTLGLPIWITELDVVAVDENVRADDLEVVLREAYAHPGVEGVLLWGFWESVMWRENAHLVNVDGTVNEAGRRYLALKQEWLSHANRRINGCRNCWFRGFHGGYNIEVTLPWGERINRFIAVEKGESPLVLNISL